MNAHLEALIVQARALRAAATPGTWVVLPGGTKEAPPIAETCVFSSDVCVARCGPLDAASEADAELIVFAVNNLITFCDALADEKKLANAVECMTHLAHKESNT